MNAYEGKAGMVYLQVKLCDPCLSALRYSLHSIYKALYKYSSFPFILHADGIRLLFGGDFFVDYVHF